MRDWTEDIQPYRDETSRLLRRPLGKNRVDQLCQGEFVQVLVRFLTKCCSHIGGSIV